MYTPAPELTLRYWDLRFTSPHGHGRGGLYFDGTILDKILSIVIHYKYLPNVVRSHISDYEYK